MKCIVCQEPMKIKYTDVNYGWKDYDLIIRGVKTHVCKNCGHEVFESKDVEMMEELSRALYEASTDSRPDILNVEEVSDLLQVSTQTVYNLIKNRKIPATKVGREWRFSRQQIIKMIEDPSESDISSSATKSAVLLAARNGLKISNHDAKILNKYLEAAANVKDDE